MNTVDLTPFTLELIKEAGIQSAMSGYSARHCSDPQAIALEFVSWVANEWSDGYCQYLCDADEAEAGLHYDHARDYINDMPEHFITEYKRTL